MASDILSTLNTVADFRSPWRLAARELNDRFGDAKPAEVSNG